MTVLSNDNRLAAILSDGADGATIATDVVATALDKLEASAVAMAMALAASESAVGMAAKDWGCQYLNLVKVHGQDGDSLAERTRAALGWKDLKGEAGSVIKRRFNTWRSNVGVLSGRWSEVEASVQQELLGGVKSFITVYKTLIEADKAAKAAKAAEEAAAAKAAETAPTTVTPTPTTETTDTVEVDVIDLIETVTLAIGDMDSEQMAAITEAFNAMVAAYDSRLVSLVDVAPEAIAANG